MDLMGEDVTRIKMMLDFASRRQQVIQENLANVNTPGYKAKTIKFDEALEEYMVVHREGLNPRQDGNNVVLELETAEARKNALWYRIHLQALAQMQRRHRQKQDRDHLHRADRLFRAGRVSALPSG